MEKNFFSKDHFTDSRSVKSDKEPPYLQLITYNVKFQQNLRARTPLFLFLFFNYLSPKMKLSFYWQKQTPLQVKNRNVLADHKRLIRILCSYIWRG